MTLLKTKDLEKTFYMGETEVHALKKVNVEINAGEFVAIKGTSGSGKSTLMHLLGCLDVVSAGEIFLEEKNIAHMTKDELAHIRNQKMGFVFQKFHLLPNLTATDNVALPKLYAGAKEKEAKKHAKKILEAVNLGDRTTHYPYQLSGGQQQRVAVARALINKPTILLADEPTGNLDTATGNAILDLFKTLNEKHNVTIIIVTHEPAIAQKTKRIIELIDGMVVKDERSS